MSIQPTKAQLLSKAIQITSLAFFNKLDKGGNPYILHCLYVMNQMPQNDYELMAIAVLHDLVEDTEWTLQGLSDQGFSERVVNAVTRLKGLTSKDFKRLEQYCRSYVYLSE